jgi:hypothetical protein
MDGYVEGEEVDLWSGDELWAGEIYDRIEFPAVGGYILSPG